MTTYKVHRRIEVYEVAFVEAESKEQALELAREEGEFEFSYSDCDEIIGIDKLNNANEAEVCYYLENEKFIDEVELGTVKEER